MSRFRRALAKVTADRQSSKPASNLPAASSINAVKERHRRAMNRWRRKRLLEEDELPATSLTDPNAFKTVKKGLVARVLVHQNDLDGRKGEQNQREFNALCDLSNRVSSIDSLLNGLDDLRIVYHRYGRRALNQAYERLLEEEQHTVKGDKLGLDARKPRKLLQLRKARIQSIERTLDWCERCFSLK